MADAEAKVLPGSEEEDGLTGQRGIPDGVSVLAWTEIEGVGRVAPLVKVLHGDERFDRSRLGRLRGFRNQRVLDLQDTPLLGFRSSAKRTSFFGAFVLRDRSGI